MACSDRVPLTPSQCEVLRLFYANPKKRVVFNKKERDAIWHAFKANRTLEDLDPALNLEHTCPAILDELAKSIDNNKNIQSAVFSECSYAQTLANILGLDSFYNYSTNLNIIPSHVLALLKQEGLQPRYVYASEDHNEMLVQAGGHGGVDAALISVNSNKIYTIEFKEPGAKTSEPDLPAYGEDGKLVVTSSWLENYPQFESMLREQRCLNFWRAMGSNVNNFSAKAIQAAVSENYNSHKKADVICVEDTEGNLTMIPANQADIWANLQGEIRPAGRNHKAVWTPETLNKYITNTLNGAINPEQVVSVPENNMATSSGRGGDGTISRYKINSIFFIRANQIRNVSGSIVFKLENVRQLIPTITAKMFFDSLSFDTVRSHYQALIDTAQQSKQIMTRLKDLFRRDAID